MLSMNPLLADLAEFIQDHRPLRPPDRRRHRACEEWLPATGGVCVWGGIWALDHALGYWRWPSRNRPAELAAPSRFPSNKPFCPAHLSACTLAQAGAFA